MNQRPTKMRTIGLIGGASNVATMEYYRFLNAAVNDRLGGWEIAETLIAGMNFGNIEAFLRTDDWDGLTAYIDAKTAALKAGGADLLLCVSNTLHKPLEPIAAAHGIEMIHIADPTGEAIKAADLSRVALFGTKPVMAQAYQRARYTDRHGIEVVVPSDAEQDEINTIIFDELVKGIVTDASRARYLAIARRLMDDEGAQGLILGCTEIFLLLHPSDAPDLPMFNTAELHCQAAVARALAP